MSSKIIFHIPKDFIGNYNEQAHLALFGKIEDVFHRNGGTVEIVQRDARMKNGNDPYAINLINDDNLHIIENGWVGATNVLNATIAYIPPFWHLDPKGVLCNSTVSTAEYNPEAVKFDIANKMFQDLRKHLVEKRHSRYGQPHEVEAIPENSIAVFCKVVCLRRKAVHIARLRKCYVLCTNIQKVGQLLLRRIQYPIKLKMRKFCQTCYMKEWSSIQQVQMFMISWPNAASLYRLIPLLQWRVFYIENLPYCSENQISTIM